MWVHCLVINLGHNIITEVYTPIVLPPEFQRRLRYPRNYHEWNDTNEKHLHICDLLMYRLFITEKKQCNKSPLCCPHCKQRPMQVKMEFFDGPDYLILHTRRTHYSKKRKKSIDDCRPIFIDKSFELPLTDRELTYNFECTICFDNAKCDKDDKFSCLERLGRQAYYLKLLPSKHITSRNYNLKIHFSTPRQ